MNYFLVILIPLFSGCALHYYDAETHAQHLFGFGHMVMKIEQADSKPLAAFSGTSSLGFAMGNTIDGFFLNAGWSTHRSIQVLDADASLGLVWPNADWLNMSVVAPPDSSSPVTHKELPR